MLLFLSWMQGSHPFVQLKAGYGLFSSYFPTIEIIDCSESAKGTDKHDQ